MSEQERKAMSVEPKKEVRSHSPNVRAPIDEESSMVVRTPAPDATPPRVPSDSRKVLISCW
jgi:hypothetical protein